MLLIFMPYLLLTLKIGLWVFGVIFLLNGLNELFFDTVKALRELWRRFVVFGWRHRKPLTEYDLLSRPEQPIAVMIPCWDESAVIRRMLENSLQVLNYANYVIFV
jgi:adsorption protein B